MFTLGPFTIKFKHVRHDPKEWERYGWWAETICTIFEKGNEIPVASGVHLFVLGENFSRPKGRKGAFAAALKNWLPHEFRHIFWVKFAFTYPRQKMGDLTDHAATLRKYKYQWL